MVTRLAVVAYETGHIRSREPVKKWAQEMSSASSRYTAHRVELKTTRGLANSHAFMERGARAFPDDAQKLQRHWLKLGHSEFERQTLEFSHVFLRMGALVPLS